MKQGTGRQGLNDTCFPVYLFPYLLAHLPPGKKENPDAADD
jgi:hypothetical protein